MKNDMVEASKQNHGIGVIFLKKNSRNAYCFIKNCSFFEAPCFGLQKSLAVKSMFYGLLFHRKIIRKWRW